MADQPKKKYVIVIPDGAADREKRDGHTPLEIARIPAMDEFARRGVNGLMRTLWDDLPKGSIVAQLGILGYDPYVFYPKGRASAEALALGIDLGPNDLAFRANLVRMNGNQLQSYNAHYIQSQDAQPLIDKINRELADEFPTFSIHHNSDFRNVLIIRDTDATPDDLQCPEPHESHDLHFDLWNLIEAKSGRDTACLDELNRYHGRVSEILANDKANAVFTWSPSSTLNLTPFRELHNRFEKCGVIAHMDFLHGIATSAGMDFVDIGTGRPDTDYALKGRTLLQMLRDDYDFIFCHINAPDEASHMGDIDLKISSIEETDKHIVGPLLQYFDEHPDELGAVFIAPDHYTNTYPMDVDKAIRRRDSHSVDPVPFIIWNGSDTDDVESYSEANAARGAFGDPVVESLKLFNIF